MGPVSCANSISGCAGQGYPHWPIESVTELTFVNISRNILFVDPPVCPNNSIGPPANASTIRLAGRAAPPILPGVGKPFANEDRKRSGLRWKSSGTLNIKELPAFMARKLQDGGAAAAQISQPSSWPVLIAP